MILDALTLFANNLAYNGTPVVVDLETVKAGPGNPLTVFVTGSPDLTGATGIVITDGATSAAATNALIAHTATLAGKTLQFELPSDVGQYVKVALQGSPTKGTWSAGIVLPGIQTNV